VSVVEGTSPALTGLDDDTFPVLGTVTLS
jgi:hypothetical protein